VLIQRRRLASAFPLVERVRLQVFEREKERSILNRPRRTFKNRSRSAASHTFATCPSTIKVTPDDIPPTVPNAIAAA